MNNHRKIAACYMRYSSHAQDDGNSIEAQDKAIKRYAEEHNYDLQYIYCDKAKTGKSAKRPEFQKMIADAKNQLFDVCIVHKFDRFSRSRRDSIIYKEILSEYGVCLVSVSEQFGSGPQSTVMEAISETMAEYYIKNLSNEVRKGLDVVASKGLHTGGIPPLGYDVSEDKKLVINEAEAEIVRLIFDRYANNFTYNDIAKELNAKGFKTKIGNEFTGSSFNAILQQRKYIGEYVYNRRVSEDKRGCVNSHKNKPEEEILRIPGAVPQIIDNETFEKVQKRLEMNKRKAGHYKSKSNYLLSGLIVCGECGFHYQGNCRPSGSSSNMYSSYRCGKRQNHKVGCGNSEIEKNRLETFVLEQMQKHLFSDKAIKAIVTQVNEYNASVSKNKNKDLLLYEKQLKEVDKKIKNLSNAIANGVNQDLIIEQINSLGSAKKDLEQRINDSKAPEFPPVVEADVKKALSQFPTFLKENNSIECKNFINQYIDKIVVNKETVEVTFKVASAVFNSSFPDDKTGMIKIKIEISRFELKALPKQRRKIPTNGNFGKSFLKGYEIVQT